MLDNQTKKRIDDCRDILVGKLPDPKAQIEQITIGLIYKFMDDMDKEAIELGGSVKFFADYKTPDPEFPNDRNQDKLIEFSKYRWDKLFDSKVTATEMLQLYSEAITGMDKNPNIPALFRDIFKNAYLPYRDPETLKMFLKTINEFEYSHSEKLGDAFEYLLSVMGSQGDAGQFRTPRHIIDFVTACVNPQKHETVLDPACGTAGFLLSAYKHILNQNTDPSAGSGRQGSSLKPDDRKKLATNFVGYDISPDMVRLSLVNMYLHGFATPLIHEYDSLSSEERWLETADVILANPPFMTPKGGIRPHKRFGVQANKAEVLFTDYIAEHLNPNGRAGIVVPNGIVATSQTAYKQLRKMLVQDSLIAVISLPAGVFQPYSGVKTSVLILDKRLAKKSKHILFLKIENDGFDLGAQRREIDKNDLPLALQTLEAYKNHLTVSLSEEENDMTFEDLPNLATLVEKEIVLGNKDVVLNAERYFETLKSQTVFELVKLSKICDVVRGITFGKNDQVESENDDTVKVATTKACQEFGIIDKDLYNIPKRFIKDEKKYLKEGDILISTANSLNLLGRATYVSQLKHKTSFGAFMTLVRPKNEMILPLYLFHCLKTEQAKKYYELNANTTTNISNLTFESLNAFEIPLPPLEIQQQIVAELVGYQKIIDGAKQVVNNYKPTISINPDWKMVELGEVIDSLEAGVSVNSEGRPAEIGEFGILKTSAVTYGTFLSEENKVILPKELQRAKCNPKKDSIIISRMNTEQLVGASAYVDKEYSNLFIPDRLWQTVISRKDILVKYIHLIISSPEYRKQLSEMCAGTSGSMKNITKYDLLRLTIPLPSLSEQKTIVKAIEEEQQLVNGNKRLIAIFEQKIKTKIGEVWGVKEEAPEFLMAAEPEVEYLKSKV